MTREEIDERQFDVRVDHRLCERCVDECRYPSEHLGIRDGGHQLGRDPQRFRRQVHLCNDGESQCRIHVHLGPFDFRYIQNLKHVLVLLDKLCEDFHEDPIVGPGGDRQKFGFSRLDQAGDDGFNYHVVGVLHRSLPQSHHQGRDAVGRVPLGENERDQIVRVSLPDLF